MDVSAVGNDSLTEKEYECLKKIIDDHKDKAGALIPILHEVQNKIGYLPPAAQRIIATELAIPMVNVNGIVTFYSLFTEKPLGKYVIGVCQGTGCYVKGKERLLEKIKDLLGIEPGQTTKDGMYSLKVVRCLGACGLGPAMSINDQIYTRVKPEQFEEILKRLATRQG